MAAKAKIYLAESVFIPELEKRVRLSDLSFLFFRTLGSRKAVKNAVKQGLIYVNGQRGYTADYIQGGELIEVYKSEIKAPKRIIDLKLEVLFEDDFLAIVNKPAGIEVSGNKNWTLEHALAGNLKKSTRQDATIPEPIHRLDYPTSGAILIGKTRSIIIRLNKLFEERMIQKTYYAICIGKMESKGLVETSIDEKPCKSEYEVIQSVVSLRFEYLNLVKLIPHTGRRHQLRIHMARIGNPILGDLLYGKEGLLLKGKGLYLHASSLEFVHPVNGNSIHILAELPKKFRKIFS